MTMISTLYTSDFSASLYAQLKQIKLLVCDVDGVFSDGRIYLGNQGEEDKLSALTKLMQTLKLAPEQVASMGDDMPDVGMYQCSAIKIAVQDAHPFVRKQANWVTEINGGFGAVREVTDTFLQVHNKLTDIHGASV